MVLSQLLEDLCHVSAMFGQVPGVYEGIVDVDNDKPLEELPEQFIHVVLVYRG